MPQAARRTVVACSACDARAAGTSAFRVAAPAPRPYVRAADRWGRALAELGLVPLGRRDLAEVLPQHFLTEMSAKKWLQSAHKNGTITKGCTFPRYRYRRAGQRGNASVVVVDPTRHPDPRAVLEAVLGPIVHFEAMPPPVGKRLTLSGSGAPRPPPADPPPPVPAPALPGVLPMRMPAQVRVPQREPPRSIPRVVDPPNVPRMRAPAPDATTPAGRLDQLAREIGRLTISHRDPEAFYEQRSEIAGQLRSIARQVA